MIAIRERETGEPATLESFRGWGFSRPVLGAALAIFLLSLGGFPPTAGFLAKFYLFAAAINAGYTYLPSSASPRPCRLGYYLRVGLALYDRRAASRRHAGAGARELWAGICAVLAVAVVFWLGIYPPDVLDWAGDAARRWSRRRSGAAAAGEVGVAEPSVRRLQPLVLAVGEGRDGVDRGGQLLGVEVVADDRVLRPQLAAVGREREPAERAAGGDAAASIASASVRLTPDSTGEAIRTTVVVSSTWRTETNTRVEPNAPW